MEKRVFYSTESTARMLNSLPEYDIRRKEKKKLQPRKVKHLSVMSFTSLLFLGTAVIVSVLLCINYLNIQAEITETKSGIKLLEEDVDVLKTQNDSVEYEVKSYVDVNYIIQTAKNELGMVQAGNSQVVFYESTPGEFMNQYKDVPKN
jgi:cell division protein FtsB